MQDKETPADGVVTGYGVIDGNLVYVYSQDASVIKGCDRRDACEEDREHL